MPLVTVNLRPSGGIQYYVFESCGTVSLNASGFGSTVANGNVYRNVFSASGRRNGRPKVGLALCCVVVTFLMENLLKASGFLYCRSYRVLKRFH